MDLLVRRMLRLVALIALTIVVLEGALQGAAWVVRQADRNVEKSWQGDGLRVLAVGDSNTYGLYLDEEDSYPSQLEALWNAKHPEQAQIEVLNLGYPGNGTAAILQDYKRLLATLQPDVVLLLVGANDYWALPAEADSSPDQPGSRWKILQDSRLYRLWRITRAGNDSPRSETLDFRAPEVEDQVKDMIRRHENVSETITVSGENFSFGFRARGEPAAREEGDRVLAENLRKLAVITRESGALLLALTYPSSEGLYQLANQVIRAEMKEQDTLLDVNRDFETVCRKEAACAPLFLSDQHPTRQGYGLVASVLERELEAQLRKLKQADQAENREP